MSTPKATPASEPMVECHCQNCGWTGLESEVTEAKDLFERVAVGDEMPAGECPECGSFAYYSPGLDSVAEAAPELLAALIALVGAADLGEVDLDDEDRAKLENARAAIAKAEGKCPSAIPAMDTHVEHAPGVADDKPWFRNFYKCSEVIDGKVCGAEWEDEHDCTCNDRCPKCNAETEPHHSEDAS